MPKKKSVKKVKPVEETVVVEQVPTPTVIQEETVTVKEKRGNRFIPIFSKKFILIGGLILVIGGVAAIPGYYYYREYQEAQLLLKDAAQTGQREAEATIAEVGKIFELPAGEQPEVATVSDITKLMDQPFFSRAQNGDRVLMYARAGKAILYRPTTKKIVEVAPFSVPQEADVAGTATQSAQVSVAPVEPPKIVLLNGTNVTGLTRQAESKLTDSKIEVEVLDRDNAVKRDYTDTIVVDVAGKRAQDAASLANALGGTVAELPDGQTVPDGTEILIILGSSFSE